jgi:hypothetical protein
LSAELIANRSDRRLPNLLGCKAREADGLMSGRRANFHHGPEPTAVPLRGRIHACNRISDHHRNNLAHRAGSIHVTPA